MPTTLLIDGYNLMYAAGLEPRRRKPGELERSRQRLLKRVSQGLSRGDRSATVVVFDARTAPDIALREEIFEGLRIFYPHDGDADALIEDMIEDHPSPRQLRVVSSDRRLKRAAERRKSKAVSSDEFLDEIDRRKNVAHQVDSPEDSSAAPPVPRTKGVYKAPGTTGAAPRTGQSSQAGPDSHRPSPGLKRPGAEPPPSGQAGEDDKRGFGDVGYWQKEFADVAGLLDELKREPAPKFPPGPGQPHPKPPHQPVARPSEKSPSRPRTPFEELGSGTTPPASPTLPAAPASPEPPARSGSGAKSRKSAKRHVPVEGQDVRHLEANRDRISEATFWEARIATLWQELNLNPE